MNYKQLQPYDTCTKGDVVVHDNSEFLELFISDKKVVVYFSGNGKIEVQEDQNTTNISQYVFGVSAVRKALS